MSEGRLPSRQSRRGLDWFSFFIANLQTGFGPFVSVYLTTQRWTQTDIGLVLTIGGVVGLLLQTPAGALVDASHQKRTLASAAVAAVGIAALGLATSSIFPVICAAWILHACASCVIGPCISAISLGLVGHDRISARLGRNASFGSAGNAVAAAAMGGIGYYVSNQAVFIVTAALMLPALWALRSIRKDEIDPVLAAGSDSKAEEPAGGNEWRILLASRPLLMLLACVTLFYVANAALLPLVGSALTMRSQDSPALFIAACIIAPQIAVTVLSPLVGKLAQSWGRRPLLVIAFAVLPVRALCFGLIKDPHLYVLAQSLDGISGAVLGVLIPLVIADATRRTGHFAFAQGLVGTGIGVGASASTLFAGLLADKFGSGTAFLGLAAVATLPLLLVFLAMPETRPGRETRGGMAAKFARTVPRAR